MKHTNRKAPDTEHTLIKAKAIGPITIVHPEWPSGTEMTIRNLAHDNLNRVYAVGNKKPSDEQYMVRILPDLDLDNDRRADIDLEFGENGFVPLLPGHEGALVINMSEIIEITDTHLTLSAVLSNTSEQTCLFRFLINGQVDTAFGVNGFVIFPELPDSPASPAPAPPQPLIPAINTRGTLDQQPRIRATTACHEIGTEGPT